MLVTALELASLNLWGTQLVVLSACSTARSILSRGREGAVPAQRTHLPPPFLTSRPRVALAHRGSVEWQHVDTASLQVRELSDAFIADYLDAEWPEVGYTVGVFRMEARGVQLFERIDGDHFTILGMPLIPLLGALRERGLLLA
jgi:hypothetical protein